jgi:3-isopropylmalate/(R)-2-methylmalate dehydratase large subunit
MTQPRTLLDKLWDAHEILRRDDGACLLWVDRHLVHEGSHHAFAKIGQKQIRVKEPNLTFGVLDHYVPTNRVGIQIDPSIPRMMQTLRDNAAMHGFKLFDMTHQNQGIVHVIGPELGLTLPGLLVNCGDSHTSTHGAFGALAFGIGATEVAHVLATQTIWQRKPLAMRIKVEGTLGPSVTAKDIALNWISLLGADGARGHAIEYAGSTIEALSMEGRMTLCNLSIEGGARFGMIAPDQITFDYVKNRRYAPQGQKLEVAMEDWLDLKSDPDAYFDREITLRAEDIAPIVTWGTSPEQAVPVTATIPVLENLEAPKAEAAKAALEYMGLEAGRPLIGTPVDQIFIGSCTNGRIEDLRAAAEVLQGRRAVIPGLISPGSVKIKAMAESEGLDKVFKGAGLEWAGAGCSMCVGMNGDLVAAGKRCASSTNRNFRGRQGKGARTHLMSPAMVAAAAVTGTICDVRDLLSGKAN